MHHSFSNGGQESRPTQAPCICSPTTVEHCPGNSSSHICICLLTNQILAIRPWSRVIREVVSISVCRARKEKHACICQEICKTDFTSATTRLCLCETTHQCRCRIDPSTCKKILNEIHDCSCIHDPLACKFSGIIEKIGQLPSQHECVCRMQWYDGWQRVCRVTPASGHDCTCRYAGLTCRASGSDIIHADKPVLTYSKVVELPTQE